MAGTLSRALAAPGYFTVKVRYFDVAFFHGAWPW